MIRVYWNIHKQCWSVVVKGRVVAHADTLWLKNVSPRLSQAGRLRVIRDGRKNVHAYLEGELGAPPGKPLCQGQIIYNPWQHKTFLLEGNEYVGSQYVKFTNKMALAYG